MIFDKVLRNQSKPWAGRKQWGRQKLFEKSAAYRKTSIPEKTRLSLTTLCKRGHGPLPLISNRSLRDRPRDDGYDSKERADSLKGIEPWWSSDNTRDPVAYAKTLATRNATSDGKISAQDTAKILRYFTPSKAMDPMDQQMEDFLKTRLSPAENEKLEMRVEEERKAYNQNVAALRSLLLEKVKNPSVRLEADPKFPFVTEFTDGNEGWIRTRLVHHGHI